jgi:hypothetical protein
LKTTKPTGNGVCPPNVERAQEIDRLINERAGTRDLNDSDFDADLDDTGDPDAPISISSDECTGLPPASKKLTASITRPEAPLVRRSRNTNGMELVQKLSQAFDPSVQRARDDARANRSLENTQFLSLSQQVRDSQGLVETLRSQVMELQSRVYAASSARDRAELKLEMIELSRGFRPMPVQPSDPPPQKKVKSKRRQEKWYPDGGRAIYYVTDDDSSDNLSNKENVNPTTPIHSRYHRRTRSDRCTYSPIKGGAMQFPSARVFAVMSPSGPSSQIAVANSTPDFAGLSSSPNLTGLSSSAKFAGLSSSSPLESPHGDGAAAGLNLLVRAAASASHDLAHPQV